MFFAFLFAQVIPIEDPNEEVALAAARKRHEVEEIAMIAYSECVRGYAERFYTQAEPASLVVASADRLCLSERLAFMRAAGAGAGGGEGPNKWFDIRIESIRTEMVATVMLWRSSLPKR